MKKRERDGGGEGVVVGRGDGGGEGVVVGRGGGVSLRRKGEGGHWTENINYSRSPCGSSLHGDVTAECVFWICFQESKSGSESG